MYRDAAFWSRQQRVLNEQSSVSYKVQGLQVSAGALPRIYPIPSLAATALVTSVNYKFVFPIYEHLHGDEGSSI